MEIEINRLVKKHRGGCVIYSLASIFGENPKEIEKKLGVGLDYSFLEDELKFLEKYLPVKVAKKFDKKGVKNDLQLRKASVVLFDWHAYVIYGYDGDGFLLYDPSGRELKKKKLELKKICKYTIRSLM